MPKIKEEIRHNLYDFLEAKYGKLDKDSQKTIRRLILQHEKAITRTQQFQMDRLTSMVTKIEGLLHKASKVPRTERIIGNIETLNFFLKWFREPFK